MKEYHKIQTVFLRDPETKFRTLLDAAWALPEFKMLNKIPWNWTEKIDGTNIRVMWDGTDVRFGGKTDNASIPMFLLKNLQNIFTKEKMIKQFGGEPTSVCLYGEGYGAKIQKGGGCYIPDDTSFILFDCRIGELWLTRESVNDIAEKLNIDVVPFINTGHLDEAVEYAKKGFKSQISQNKDHMAEGLVMKPQTDLFNRAGSRIIAKIKFKDF